MSDDEVNAEEEKGFSIEVANQGRAVCKKCKEKCLKGEIRVAKLVANPFGEGKMKAWHHVNCIFEVLLKQRATTKRIESIDDIDGWNSIPDEDKEVILEKIKEYNEEFYKKHGITPTKKSPLASSKQKSPKGGEFNSGIAKESTSSETVSRDDSVCHPTGKPLKDNSFKEFRRLIADITNNSAYTDKTNCVKKMFSSGSDGKGFKGDTILWCRLLLPGVVKRVYNLQSKQLIKLFSRIFGADQDEMLEHLEQGDIGETIQEFFENSNKLKPVKNCNLTIQDVDKFLERLSKLTKEDDQIEHFQSFAKRCTSNDLKIVIRLIKGDLRMGAGAKHILEGVHPDAYEAYQASRDLEAVLSKCLNKTLNDSKLNKAEIKVMTPVLPMLAEACKSVEQAMKKCPNGMYSEIKYDGERVQVHKCGSDFKYFSRSLKPVMPHKIQHFKDYIPKAFPHAKDLILDSEILMIDTNTGKPLPFGTLGVHKKAEFKDANVCLFIFDCIYYNGESLVQKPLSYRKKILQENMNEIPNRIMFSEMEKIHKSGDLAKMIAEVLKLGLEGLVLKDLKSIYEPGKRHWLKVKKDYLFEGAMADTADLIVLGAWYGTGKKGGMMSVFLMGCYNPNSKRFCTVTKVHTGHDDKTLERLQEELDMEKISQDSSKVPRWLNCTKSMIPDFVAKDPKKQPVWEITGAEFTRHDVHTADGISIRFPRVTRIRNDKTWENATNLQELQQLYKNSKENTDVSLLTKRMEKDYEDESSSKKNKKVNSSNSPQKRHNESKYNENSITDDEEKLKEEKQLYKNSKENKDFDLGKKTDLSENESSPVKKKKKSSNSKSPRKGYNESTSNENSITDIEDQPKEEKLVFKNNNQNKDVGLEKDFDRNEDESPINKKRKGSNATITPQKKYIESKSSERSTTDDEGNEVKVVPPKKKRKVKGKSPLKQTQNETELEDEISVEEHNESKDVSKKKYHDVQIINPLPDYFCEVKALIEDELRKDKHSEIIRNFIAYGGQILDSECWSEATHVFHYFNFIKEPVIKSPYTARHVSIEWIKDSIAEKSIQDFRLYTVQWDPEM